MQTENIIKAACITIVVLFSIHNATGCVNKENQQSADKALACIKQGSSYVHGQCVAGKGTTP